MILLSFRKNFDSPIFFGQPRVKLGDGLEISLDELARRIRGRRVLLVGHGYRNNVRDTMDSFGTIEQTLRFKGLLDESGQTPGAYELVVGVLWPGSFAVFGFWLAWLRADRAGKELADLMDSWFPAALDIETHSLFARVSLEALKSLALGGSKARVRNLFLTAPAVPADAFHRLDLTAYKVGKYLTCCTKVDKIHVLFSQADRVLSLIYPTAMFHSALGHAGPVGDCPSNVFRHDCTSSVPSHGSYKSSWMLYDYWARVLLR